MNESHESIREPIVRTLHSDEWQIHRDLRLRAFEDSPQAFGSTLEEMRERSEGTWRAWLEDSKVYIAEIDSVPVAAVTFQKDINGVWAVHGVWTDPRFRNRGMSKRLFEKVFADARAQGIDSIRLDLNSAQKAALHTYESLGFSVLKTDVNQRWGDGSVSDGIVMVKKL